MKILAFAASSSRESINKQLAACALSQYSDAQTQLLDLNDYELPIYSIDKEKESGIPDKAKEFFEKIGNSDALIIAFAEHNGSYTAAYKNIFDWMSRIDQKVFQSKPMIMLATSPGKGGAKNVLAQATASAPYFGGELKGSLSIANFYSVFDSSKATLNDETLKLLNDVLKNLKELSV